MIQSYENKLITHELVTEVLTGLKTYDIKLTEVAEKSKEIGQQGGKGYSYHHFRKVFTYKTHYNKVMVDLAMDMIEAEIDRRNTETALLHTRLNNILAKDKAA